MTQFNGHTLSIEKSFANKTLLVSGVSGFLGKVWLSMFLKHVESFSHVYLLIRKKGTQSAQDRFIKMIHESLAFSPWFENDSFDAIQKILLEKVTIVEGDVSCENFGLSTFEAERLQKKIDLLINISGLVDFRPSLENAYRVNVQGALYTAKFIDKCAHAKLVHVSTAYVAGDIEGAISETVQERTPKNQDFEPDTEIQWIEFAIKKTKEKFFGKEKTREMTSFLRKRNEQKNKQQNIKQFQKTLDQLREKEIKQELIRIGSERAQKLGWPNTYTYTKALAERLLKTKFDHLTFTIVRPSIVESSHHYPFAGWNEGFNTTGPIAYLVKGWFRYFPADEDHPFDVIPVDTVVTGLTIASAQLLSNEQTPEVFHINSCFLNSFTIGDACVLSSQYYEKFYRETGKTFFEKYLNHRKTVATVRDHLFSSKNMFQFFSKMEKHLENIDRFPTIFQTKMAPLRKWISRSRRKLEQAENLLSIFKPYTSGYVQIFLSKNIIKPIVEESVWQYTMAQLNWEEYWINAQMPGLQRFCFPVIEAKPVPVMQPDRRFLFEASRDSIEVVG